MSSVSVCHTQLVAVDPRLSICGMAAEKCIDVVTMNENYYLLLYVIVDVMTYVTGVYFIIIVTPSATDLEIILLSQSHLNCLKIHGKSP